jgi:hypothetical protein
MEMDLKSYIRVYDEFIDRDICDRTVKVLENEKWSVNDFYDPQTKSYKSFGGENECEMFYGNIDTHETLMRDLWNVYFRYLKELQFPWFSGWSGYSKIRYNRYKENTLMIKHCDHINLFDDPQKGVPMLSVVGALNDDYEGGEFVMFDDYKIQLKKGSMLIFPSCFLYPHKVEKVTKGTRYSFVSWCW